MALLLPPLLLLLLLPVCLTTSVASTSPPEGGNSTQPWGNNHTDAGGNSTELGSSKPDSGTTNAPNKLPGASAHPSPEVTRGHRSTPERILYLFGGDVEDYYDDEDDDDDRGRTIPTPPSPRLPLYPCAYDRCRHLEPPCEETQRMAGGGCLCPGVTGPAVAPDPPRMGQTLSGEGGASVSWCSPQSTVLGYRVLHGAPGGSLVRGPPLNASYRFYSIGGLLQDTHYRVCVVAFNEAGESSAEEGEEEDRSGPCRLLHTSGSRGPQIYLGLGVGMAALAGVLALAGLGWWVWGRGRRKGEGVGGEKMGVPNPFYQGESEEQL
ncbi:hypothetical protein FKM82_020939 [Ascaphus truei]